MLRNTTSSEDIVKYDMKDNPGASTSDLKVATTVHKPVLLTKLSYTLFFCNNTFYKNQEAQILEYLE